MAILSLQRRLSEVGRIRLGQQIETKGGKKRPAALTTFRLTSSDKARIEEAAKLYGGKVTQWDAPSGLAAWEVITEAEKLPVVVPPSAMAFSQHYELWSAGGCKRRCDGVTETLSEQPCVCDPESRECDIHTRLSVMLRDLSGLGVWRVDTQGYYAALELQGAVDVISLAAGRGQMLPATLRLDQRVIKREGEPQKRFVVPVLDVEVSPAQLLMGTVGITGGAPVPVLVEQPPQRSLTPVPDGGPTPSIAEQVAQSENQPSRRRASTQVVPTTGLAPRTAAEAQSARPTGKYTSRVTDTFEPPENSAAVSESAANQPRMCSTPQLTKLGILLNKQGFDKTDEGKAARLDFCQAAIRQMFPDSPHSSRTITSSKELTFAEAHSLIDMLETEERKDRAREEKRPMADEGVASHPSAGESDEPVAEEPPAESMEDAAEQIRRRRAESASGSADSSDEDPLADSPHGLGCEPGCTLTEAEHPPFVPATENEESSSTMSSDTQETDKKESLTEPDPNQMTLG